MVSSTTAAGTISHAARGFSSFFTKSSTEVAPVAFSFASSSTACCGHVEDDAIVTALDEPSHHVRAHPAQTDHPELHDLFLSSLDLI